MSNPEKSKPSSVLQPCPCGKSSDACSYWDTGGWYCHSCNEKGHLKTVSKTPAERGISDATLRHYGINFTPSLGTSVFEYHSIDGDTTGYKDRTADKKFSWSNKPSKVKLFGQNLFPNGGKFLTITEGELDACYAFEAMGSKFPVVSVDSAGAAPGNCKDNYDWINSFETIVLAFDNDKPGMAAAAKVADLFPGKTKIVKFKQDCKDPCDYGPNGKAEFVQSWWRAEVPVVEGLIPSSQLIDAVISTPRPKCFDYPWSGLNDITAGWRLGELVMIGAGTGIGKTLFMTHVADKVIQETDFNIGVLFLEDPNIDAARRFVAVRGRVPYHLPTTLYDENEFKAVAHQVLDKDRIIFYNNENFGSNSKDSVIAKIKMMIRVHNCKIFFLDHITFITSATAEGDERRSIDEMMTEIKSLTVTEGVNIHAVSHFKRLSGTSHENGAAGSINDFRGSGAIAQLANVALSLERNQQALDPAERNTTTVRVLKNRLSGKTGEACKLAYSEWPFTWDQIGNDVV